MFADDTNCIYFHKNIEGLFYAVNSELEKVSQWFKANKLSINIKKTKFTLFHKNSFKDDIPVKFPSLMVGSNSVEKTSSIKFLGVMLDEHISWIDHVRTVENKIAKNIGLLYGISHFLNEDSLKTTFLAYSFLFELCKYCKDEYVCNKIEKSLFETKTCSMHCI